MKALLDHQADEQALADAVADEQVKKAATASAGEAQRMAHKHREALVDGTATNREATARALLAAESRVMTLAGLDPNAPMGRAHGLVTDDANANLTERRAVLEHARHTMEGLANAGEHEQARLLGESIRAEEAALAEADGTEGIPEHLKPAMAASEALAEELANRSTPEADWREARARQAAEFEALNARYR